MAPLAMATLAVLFKKRQNQLMSRQETQDVQLSESFDIQFDDEGDILTRDFFDTSLLMSVFCERRALASEMQASHLRRGWIGNIETPDFEIGSKLWLYYQARKTAETATGITTVLTNALKWLVDDDFAVSYDVQTRFTDAGAFAEITIVRTNSKVEKRLFELWQNTGN
jgi:phage gp46-like protein